VAKPSRAAPSDPVPPIKSLRDLTAAAQDCQACPLFANATQAVFGKGPTASSMFLIGEQPGDAEDRAGRPFVGPAVCLGTSAAQALLSPNVTIASAKNQVYETPFGPVVVTRHPSSVLRIQEQAERRAAFEELVADLRRAVAVGRRG